MRTKDSSGRFHPFSSPSTSLRRSVAALGGPFGDFRSRRDYCESGVDSSPRAQDGVPQKRDHRRIGCRILLVAGQSGSGSRHLGPLRGATPHLSQLLWPRGQAASSATASFWGRPGFLIAGDLHRSSAGAYVFLWRGGRSRPLGAATLYYYSGACPRPPFLDAILAGVSRAPPPATELEQPLGDHRPGSSGEQSRTPSRACPHGRPSRIVPLALHSHGAPRPRKIDRPRRARLQPRSIRPPIRS